MMHGITANRKSKEAGEKLNSWDCTNHFYKKL